MTLKVESILLIKDIKYRHPDFTGISAPYEAPEKAEVVIDTDNTTVDEAVKTLVKYLEDEKYI